MHECPRGFTHSGSFEFSSLSLCCLDILGCKWSSCLLTPQRSKGHDRLQTETMNPWNIHSEFFFTFPLHLRLTSVGAKKNFVLRSGFWFFPEPIHLYESSSDLYLQCRATVDWRSHIFSIDSSWPSTYNWLSTLFEALSRLIVMKEMKKIYTLYRFFLVRKCWLSTLNIFLMHVWVSKLSGKVTVMNTEQSWGD